MPINFCFSKLCSKSKINKEYEAVPYDQTAELPSPVKTQIAQNRSRLDHLNKLKKVTAKRNLFNDCVENKTPDFQSTKLEQSSVNFATEFKQLGVSKITSTMIQHNTYASFESEQTAPSLTCISEEESTYSSAYSNSTYSSPISVGSSIFTTDSSDFEQTQYYTNPSCESECFRDVNPSYFELEVPQIVYVCVQSYQPHFQGDIELKYTERVTVLHATADFSLVKKISTQEFGYVPSTCLTSLSSFIKSVC